MSAASQTIPPAARHPSRTRRWFPYAGALALVALIVGGLWPRPVPVETARASYGSLRTTIDEEGRTRIRQVYTLAAPVAGHLRRIDLKPGAPVQANATVLAIVDPLPPTPLDARTRALAETRRDSAVAVLERARAAQALAVNELRRIEQLDREGAVAAQDLDTARWRETSATRDLAAAQAALRQAEAELADFDTLATQGRTNNGTAGTPTVICGTANGRVLRVFEESARVVAAGTPLLQVGDPADLEVVIEVLSRDGAAMAPETPVEFDQWGGTNALAGRVRLIEPAGFTKISALGVEEQRVNVIADILTPPEQRPGLGDGFRVEAHIVLWRTDRTLKVPAGALFRRGAGWAAFVAANGRAQLRRVRVGHSSGTETQILEGLDDGDIVVLYPGDRIREGQRIRPVTI